MKTKKTITQFIPGAYPVKGLFLKALLSIFALSLTIITVRAGGTPVYTVASEGTSLTIRSYGTNSYGIGIGLDSAFYEQSQPCQVQVVLKGSLTAAWYAGSYLSVQDLGGGSYKCIGIVSSANGSKFRFTDTYSLLSTGTFQVSRTVTVIALNMSDLGFSSRLTFAQTVNSSMTDYDFFAPGIWYKNNADVADFALATDYSDNDYWFREDRMPLPIFMLRNKGTGVTFSVCHKSPDGSTFTGEDGLNLIVDSRLKFASMGMSDNTNPSVGILFPGTEGERTGVYGNSTSRRWALRANPISYNFSQNYSLAFRLTKESDFTNAMKNTWISYFKMFAPPLYNCNLTTVYDDQINLLDYYWKSVNGSSGFPFKVLLNGTLATEYDYTFDLGFVGQQIANASLLLREGINTNNSSFIAKAENTIDWWANNAITNSGCPMNWYDPIPKTWRFYPSYARVIGEGMEGLLWAWNFEKKRGVDKVDWLNACFRVANWLLTKQGTDGSFARAWNWWDNTVAESDKTNTSHLIPFLVDMYKISGYDVFKTAAIKAGNYTYTDVYQNFRYVGGTPDNPNVPDKEAASMALRAFLSLYDLDGQQKWLDASKQTAYYYETWLYSWNVPIPADDNGATYPKNRSTTGLSLIATANNAADTYAAIDAFSFYRMYLYTGDLHLKDMSEFLLRNTKQAVNSDRNDPIPGYGRWGIVQEAMTVMVLRGHGVGVYLPWQTYNMIEPFVLLKDVFGAGYDIHSVDSLPNKSNLHNNYSATRNFESSNTNNIADGDIYIIVNKNSGKVLEINNGLLTDGANIQQGEYTGAASQQWKCVTSTPGFWKLEPQNSLKCAEVAASSIADLGNVRQNSYTGALNQQWLIAGVGGGYWTITNGNSWKCMDVLNFSTTDGANVIQYTSLGGVNQHWLFVKVKAKGDVSRISKIVVPKVTVYPNPAKDRISVAGLDNDDLLAGIYNIAGDELLKLKTKDREINISNLKTGLYILRVKTDDGVHNIKFLKDGPGL